MKMKIKQVEEDFIEVDTAHKEARAEQSPISQSGLMRQKNAW